VRLALDGLSGVPGLHVVCLAVMDFNLESESVGIQRKLKMKLTIEVESI
jgi:hypothetical protein